MKLTGALLAAVAALTLTACGGSAAGQSHPSAAACKHAIQKQATHAATGATSPPEPPVCKGLPAKQLEKIIAEVLTGH